MTLPPGVDEIIAKGYEHSLNRKTIPYDHPLSKRRLMSRKWRNVVGEARFDIPRALWEYVDWTMPLEWHNTDKLYQIKSHPFVIRVPKILPMAVSYREYTNGNDWYFQSYEILTPAGDLLVSKKQEEFYYFLHMCYELVKPHRRPVKIESVPFKELADGAVKHSLTAPSYPDMDGWYCC